MPDNDRILDTPNSAEELRRWFESSHRSGDQRCNAPETYRALLDLYEHGVLAFERLGNDHHVLRPRRR